MRSTDSFAASTGREDPDVEAVGVVLGQVGVHLGDQVGVVGTGLVQPEHRRVAGRAGPGDGQLDPVADRHVLGLARPPDVPCVHVVLEQGVAGGVDDADRAGGGDLERLVVGAVLLGRLRHQTDVRDRAHRRRVVGAVLAAVVDHGLVDAGVRRVRDHRQGVALLAVGSPHVPGGTDHRRHRGVDDDVARDVQVGDALVGVDHGQLGTLRQPLLDGRADRLAVGERVGRAQEGAEPVVGRDAGGAQLVAVLLEDLGEEHLARRDRRRSGRRPSSWWP